MTSPSIRRILEIIRKEFRQTFREPRMRILLFMPPVLQLIIFGYAANLDVDNSRIAWCDLDHTPQSRDVLADFVGSNRFEITDAPTTGAEVQHLLDAGRVQGAVLILPGFGRDIQHGRTTAVQVLVDGSNSNTASIIANYASSIVAGYGAHAMDRQNRDKLVGRTAGGPVHAGIPTLGMQSRIWFNPDLRSRNYFVPGVVANIIALVTLMLTAMAIVREKEIGTMEQLMVTPIRPVELMLGKTLPFALIGIVQVTLVTIVALLLFKVPFHGSFLLLFGCALLYLMTTLGAGLFISTISRTQQQAMLSTFLFFQPFFLLSGFAFPIRNMPVLAQYLTWLDPVRYFMEIVRGVFLKGVGAEILWPQMVALAVFGVSILLLSASRFRKKLD
jgi:ABC-2 type transport system permease protein